MLKNPHIKHGTHCCNFMFSVVPLTAIPQTTSLVIKGSPAQLKSKQQTTQTHTANRTCTLTSSVEEVIFRNVRKMALHTCSTDKGKTKQKSNICFPAFSLIQLPSYMIYC